jgi:hypothetical protein
VEDALRAGRLPVTAIKETMHAVDSASRLMQRLAEAGRGAVEELGRSLKEQEKAAPAPPGDAAPAAGAPPDAALQQPAPDAAEERVPPA